MKSLYRLALSCASPGGQSPLENPSASTRRARRRPAMWSRRPSATWRANHGSFTTAPRREESSGPGAGWRQLDLELETYKRLGASLSKTSQILPCRDEAGARQLPSMETRRLHRNSAATRQLDDDLEMYKRAAAVKTRPDARPATLQGRHSRRDPSRSRSRSRSECSHDAPRCSGAAAACRTTAHDDNHSRRRRRR